MSRILINFLILLCACDAATAGTVTPAQPELVKPLGSLFSHKGHLESFKKMGIQCADCHSFSVKAVDGDPLGKGVAAGFISPNARTCHQCHMQTISLPRPDQCVLCHRDTQQLKPASHARNWRIRHGQFAEVDMDSCKRCHTDNSCESCHTQRDSLKPMVHRPNFRMTHSIEARANPQSCTVCHATTTSCVQCHSRGLQ